MEVGEFWSIVEASLQSHPADCVAQAKALEQHLASLTEAQHCGFCLRFEMMDARVSAREHLWAAAYIIRGGCSDDSWMDFRAALISRGRQVCEAAIMEPDSLADLGWLSYYCSTVGIGLAELIIILVILLGVGGGIAFAVMIANKRS
jgi:hypothetical protein